MREVRGQQDRHQGSPPATGVGGLGHDGRQEGPEVATLTIHEAESLYEVRRALEPLAGSLFAERATAEQCTELVSRLTAIKSAIALGDSERRLEAKDRYYDTLFDGAGNAEIARLLRSVHARRQMLRTLSLAAPGRETSTAAELALITAAAAVRQGPEEARIACDEHVRAAAEAALSEMRKLPAGE